MPEYTPQDMRNLLLKFTPSAHTPQTFGDVTLRFSLREAHTGSGDLRSAITAMGFYHDTTYTYLKYCEKYIVGYTQYGVQIIKGKCYYGGIRDLSAYLGIWVKPVYSADSDLTGYINQIWFTDFPAEIDTHQPANLLAYLNVLQKREKDLPTSIHGWLERYLSASINPMQYRPLSAYLNPVPSVDLSAYLKVWPMEELPANIYGWDLLDLSAQITMFQYKDLPTYIGAHPWRNLGVILRGWVREAEADLTAYLDGLGYVELPASIRATYLSHLPAYIFSVGPRDISANIKPWGALNLSAFLQGGYGEYDLQATLNIVNNFKDLPTYVGGMRATRVIKDLPARIEGWHTSDIMGYISTIPFAALSANIFGIGRVRDLGAIIYPKTVRLSSIVSVITMEHLDMSAVINPSCIWSEPRDLPAHLRIVYKSELYASIWGRRYMPGATDLFATVGRAESNVYIDKLPLSVSISTQTYMFQDKFPITFAIFKNHIDVSASIFGVYLHEDLGASVTGEYLDLYNFENVTNRIKGCNFNYSGILQSYEMVELSFKSIVEDYFYSSAGDSAWKTNRVDRWILDLKSYVPGNTLINTKRKLHKIKSLYDLDRFESIDEAVKFAIDYVISYPYDDISAYIHSSGKYVDFPASISVRRPINDSGNLQSSITGVTDEIIIGTNDEIIIL